MFKKFFIGAAAFLTLSMLCPIHTIEASANNSVKIDDCNNIILLSDDTETDGISSIQLCLDVKTNTDAEISFIFSPENYVKVSEYRYNADADCLNIYMSDSRSLFHDTDSLQIGRVSATDGNGNEVDVNVSAKQDALKYVYHTALVDNETIDIDTKPITTTVATAATTDIMTTEAATTITNTTTVTQAAATTTTTTIMTTVSNVTTDTEAKISTITTTKQAVTTTTAAKHIATDKEFCDWSIKDYFDKTGIQAANAKIRVNEENQYEITMMDDAGNVLDTYVIDPTTGAGTNSANEEVNLPQTGNNSMTKIWIAFAAISLLGVGIFTIKASGTVAHKKDEK